MTAEDIHLTSLTFREDTNPANLHLLPLIIKESEPESPVVTTTGSGGAVVVPEAIAVAEIKIIVNHISTFKKTFTIITEHVDEIIKLPIKIRHVMLQMNVAVSELVLNTFTKGLSLDIREGGLELS